MSYACYILNHISCKTFNGQIQLTKPYSVTPDFCILMMYTFYQSVYYASHNQSFPSTSEEKHAFWDGFGEHVGDAITHKLLDSSSNKIIYRSTVCNKPIRHRSHQDLDKSVSRPMAEYIPDDLIRRTVLLPSNQKGERHRASIKQKKPYRSLKSMVKNKMLWLTTSMIYWM